MSQHCPDGFGFKENSSKKGANNVLTTSLHTITSYPVNGKASLGSLYDGLTDRILTTPFISDHLIKREKINENPDCKVIRIEQSDRNNLLKKINIRENLRLSIALELTSVTDGTLMLYNYEVPADATVRLIYYSHVRQRESFSDDIQNVTEHLKTLSIDKNATHIITNIERGIDFVIAFQCPTSLHNYELDTILYELCQYFKKSNGVFLTAEKLQKINVLKPTIFTSDGEIHRASLKQISFSDLCQRIYHIVHNIRNDYLLSYTMHPVTCIYDENLFEVRQFQQIDRTIVDKLENRWIFLSNEWTRIKKSFSSSQTGLPSNVKLFNEQIQNNLTNSEQVFNETRKLLVDTVLEHRKGHLEVDLYNGIFDESVFQPLNSKLSIVVTQAKDFFAIVNIINQLKINCPIEYVNVTHIENRSDTLETVEKKILSTDKGSSVSCLCFTYELVNNGLLESQKAELCRQINVSTQLILADFSMCRNRPQTIKILTSPVSPPTINQNHVQAKEINILLVGETGVGKSTFINAFVNYLAHETFQQAVDNEPIVLIPVSSVITTGEEFTEHTVQFGQIDPNEHHQDVGESVTQNCRSYLFTINNEIKLRIIDTPGFGDTRGVQQDDKNIGQVLSYINKLSHLNAICFLLKPDVSRLNVLFRSCFTQLFHYLGSNARDNVTFCFTNTRSTFYTPGNTSMPLKEMLKQLPEDHAPPFAKSNTFCFDSESFRYLAIVKAGYQLDFDQQQKSDFEKSWTISKNESNRLFAYIKDRPQYKMNQYRSMKHAQMEIMLLARPILETLCNVVRNSSLHKTVSGRFIFKFQVQPISQMEWICPNGPFTVNQFQTVFIGIPSAQKSPITDDCPLDAHLPKFYDVHFESSISTDTNIGSVLETKKSRLLNGCLVLSHFLLSIAQASDNPFIHWIDLFIKEQEYLHTNKYQTSVNNELYQNLYKIRNLYQDKLVQMLTNNKQHDDLDTAYKCIADMLQDPEVLEQMNAARESQMNIMKTSEYDTSVHFHLN